MPLVREGFRCWILLVHQECTGDLLDFHWPVTDRASLPEIGQLRWHMFAHDPLRNPPLPELGDEPCLVVVCAGCGAQLADGGRAEHFADADHAWEAAGDDGWLGDRCRSCQPSPHPAV